MPHRLGRYVVRRRIGAGGFATVWLAHDDHLDSPVAVKVLADNWAGDHQVRERFVEEGRYLRRVESPHVVAVHDAGELEDGRPYLVMTFADRGTLADRLELESLTAAQALRVVQQIGSGLGALHARGIAHRDLKPANVLFRTVDGEVRAMVADLGLGKSLDASSRLTMIAGSPSYVAPEQARGEGQDARADQYSLAVLAHLLLAGRPPFRHASLAEAATPVPLPAPEDQPFGPAVDSVLRRGLAPDRDARWPDVESFVAALVAALEEDDGITRDSILDPWPIADPEQTHAGPAPTAPAVPVPVSAQGDEQQAPVRRRGRRGTALIGAVVVLAAGVGAGLAWQSSRADTVSVDDDQGTLSVEVPEDWFDSVGTAGWVPQGASKNYPAISVGSVNDWTDPRVDAEGVFVGLFPSDELPALLPGHPECDESDDPVTESAGAPSTTVVHSGCPTGIVVERVVQVADNRALWVQVRSIDRRTANRVLDTVRTHGL